MPRDCRRQEKIEAAHQCMTMRGAYKTEVTMVTSRMLGVFRDQAQTRQELLSAIGMRGHMTTGEAGG